MNNERTGAYLIFLIVSLFSFLIGLFIYKSTVACNTGFSSNFYNTKRASKILGSHFMVYSILFSLTPLLLKISYILSTSYLIALHMITPISYVVLVNIYAKIK